MKVLVAIGIVLVVIALVLYATGSPAGRPVAPAPTSSSAVPA